MATWSLEPFEVDLERRQLRRDGVVIELQEKPFQLLAALLERFDETVTREELCRVLWPDAEHLDFDASLNVAAGKLRKALGDSAETPRWLVTVPGRGYRLTAGSPAKIRSRPRPRRQRGVLATVGVALAALLALGWVLSERSSHTAAPETVRLAIMPLELAVDDGPDRLGLARISEWLVAELARPPAVDVIGPRTTVRYLGEPFPDLPRLAAELDIDYVLNARVLKDPNEAAVLFELIRLSDGAHPWVDYFEELEEWRTVATTARDNVSRVVEAGI